MPRYGGESLGIGEPASRKEMIPNPDSGRQMGRQGGERRGGLEEK